MTTCFTFENALATAKASRLAYDDEDRAATVTSQQWRMNRFRFFDHAGEDTQAFVCGNNEYCVLAFRGTASFRDWLTDFDAGMVSYHTGRIHGGFRKALNDVWDDVFECIQEFCDEGKPLWVTGHSLGGALATLAVDRLLRADFEIKGLYTYGQPRVGNKQFAEYFDGF